MKRVITRRIPTYTLDDILSKHGYEIRTCAGFVGRGLDMPVISASVFVYAAIRWPELRTQIHDAVVKLGDLDTPAGTLAHVMARAKAIRRSSCGERCTIISTVFYMLAEYIVNGKEPTRAYSTDIKWSVKRIDSFLKGKANG